MIIRSAPQKIDLSKTHQTWGIFAEELQIPALGRKPSLARGAVTPDANPSACDQRKKLARTMKEAKSYATPGSFLVA